MPTHYFPQEFWNQALKNLYEPKEGTQAFSVSPAAADKPEPISSPSPSLGIASVSGSLSVPSTSLGMETQRREKLWEEAEEARKNANLATQRIAKPNVRTFETAAEAIKPTASAYGVGNIENRRESLKDWRGAEEPPIHSLYADQVQQIKDLEAQRDALGLPPERRRKTGFWSKFLRGVAGAGLGFSGVPMEQIRAISKDMQYDDREWQDWKDRTAPLDEAISREIGLLNALLEHEKAFAHERSEFARQQGQDFTSYAQIILSDRSGMFDDEQKAGAVLFDHAWAQYNAIMKELEQVDRGTEAHARLQIARADQLSRVIEGQASILRAENDLALGTGSQRIEGERVAQEGMVKELQSELGLAQFERSLVPEPDDWLRFTQPARNAAALELEFHRSLPEEFKDTDIESYTTILNEALGEFEKGPSNRPFNLRHLAAKIGETFDWLTPEWRAKMVYQGLLYQEAMLRHRIKLMSGKYLTDQDVGLYREVIGMQATLAYMFDDRFRSYAYNMTRRDPAHAREMYDRLRRIPLVTEIHNFVMKHFMEVEELPIEDIWMRYQNARDRGLVTDMEGIARPAWKVRNMIEQGPPLYVYMPEYGSMEAKLMDMKDRLFAPERAALRKKITDAMQEQLGWTGDMSGMSGSEVEETLRRLRALSDEQMESLGIPVQ